MKFHDLLLQHNIDYKFHDIHDIEHLDVQYERENSISISVPNVKDVVSTAASAIESVPSVGASAGQAIRTAEESFRDLEDTQKAKLFFAMTVNDLRKKKDLTKQDLRIIAQRWIDYSEKELINEANNKSYVQLVQDNVKLLKDIVVRFLNRLKRSESVYDAVREIVTALLSSVRSVFKFIRSNYGAILRVIILGVAIGVALYNSDDIQKSAMQFFSEAKDTGTWFWSVLMGDPTAEIRDSMLTGYFATEERLETIALWTKYENERASLQNQALGIGGTIAGALIASNPAGWVLGTGLAAIGGALGFANEYLLESTVNPIYNGPFGLEGRQYDIEIRNLQEVLRARQSAAAWENIRSLWSNPAIITLIITPSFLGALSIGYAMLGVKRSKSQMKQDASAGVSCVDTVMQSMGTYYKGHSKALSLQKKLFEQLRESKWAVTNTGLGLAKMSTDALASRIMQEQKKRNMKKEEKLNRVSDSIAPAATLIAKGKMASSQATHLMFIDYLKSKSDRDGNVSIEDIESWFKIEKLDFRDIFETGQTPASIPSAIKLRF